MDLDARVRNIVSWASEALKLLRRDEHLAMVTPQNAEYSSSTQGNDAVLIKPPSSSAKPNLAFFERRRREASSQQQQETQNFASEDGNEKEEEEEEEATLSPAKHLLYATPILVRPNALHQVGGFEEWGTCSGDPLFDETLREMSIRLWRGGFKSAVFGIPEVSKTALFSRTRSSKEGTKLARTLILQRRKFTPRNGMRGRGIRVRMECGHFLFLD